MNTKDCTTYTKLSIIHSMLSGHPCIWTRSIRKCPNLTLINTRRVRVTGRRVMINTLNKKTPTATSHLPL